MTAATEDPRHIVRNFPRTREHFIGIDSDGCAFDTMEVKHKECFIPNIIKHFGLAAISKHAREAAEFVNLYSQWRGINRFPGLTIVFDLLADRPEVARRQFQLPSVPGLRAWIDRETRLGNPTLKQAVAETHDPDLELTLRWSEAVNQSVEEIVKGVPPFPLVRESLAKLREHADIMVVSATPGEALKREWQEHGLDRYVTLIAGQELGNKRELLEMAAGPRYEPSRCLMIGDAPGDFKAAESNGMLFYPIDPGHEDDSWARFHDEAIDLFFNGRFGGHYMAECVTRFQSLLPVNPHWPTLSKR